MIIYLREIKNLWQNFQTIKIKDVYFDRGKLKYHGKAKAFAESARKNGLNF